jgi:hypothetical protein
MIPLAARQPLRLVLVSLCLLSLALTIALAQNENETVGFQSNHIFESGQFGENIDILNGGLTLTTPIGPRYQVNSALGYGLTLSYDSKVWDTGHYLATYVPPNDQVLPVHEGPLPSVPTCMRQ